MRRKPAHALIAYLTAALRARTEQLRATPDRGSHAVEYAIGIGLGALAVIGLYAAYRTGVTQIVTSWVFK
jgi:Flp pilus assembly pilin Flp